MDKEKLQKEIVDAISQIAKNEASKNNKITIVKGEITGVDPLNCYYNFSYNNHLYSARSVLGGYSVGQKVFIAFSGEQENNIILCGEIIGGGTVAGSEERVLSSITQQYYISNSSEIEPPQNPGEGAQYQWSDERLEPTKEAPYLWSRYKYTYTDASVEYSTPYVINVTEAINESNETITDYIDSSIGNIQNQIDKQADIWFYNGVPTLNTYPANEWTTDKIKDIHIGDLYFDTSETAGKAYEFKKNQSTYLWQLVQDQDVIKALNNAAKAQDTADNKRRVFYATPVPPYDKGDLWVQGSNGDILYCNVPKSSGATYSRSDWVVASKYTDDSNLNIFKEEYTHYKEDNDRKWENTLGKITTIEGQVQQNTSSIQQTAEELSSSVSSINTTIGSLQDQIDGAIETYYLNGTPTLSNEPAVSWADDETKDTHIGDLYYDKDTGHAYRFMKDGSTYTWVRISDEDISKAFAEAQKANQAAQNAQSGVNSLSGRVTKNETDIRQNANDITLRAQETTELKNNLETNYYTKKQSDAAIKVSSDAITSAVSSQISSIESNAIKTTINYYLQNNGETPSKTDPSWSTSQPSWVNGKHIWLKVRTTKVDGIVSESDPVDLTGSTGATGAPGTNGVGIVSVTQQYYQSNSNTQAPSGDAGWSTTQPDYVEGKYIWIRYDTLLDNGSHSYSTPTLDQNLNGVYETIKTTKSEILQTTDSITLKVESVQQQVDGIDISRTNLLVGTQDYTNWDVSGDVSFSLSPNVNGFKEAKIINTGSGRQSLLFGKWIGTLNAGEKYTLSFFSKSQAPYDIRVYAKASDVTSSEGEATIVSQNFFVRFPADSTERKRSFTFTVTTDAESNFIEISVPMEYSFQGVTIYALKLEKGDTATEWTPSYNEGYVVKAEIIAAINSDYQSEIKIKADKISLEGIATINNNFIIDKDGSLTAKNARFSGNIEGSNINGSTITFGTTGKTVTASSTEDGNGVVFEGEGEIRIQTKNTAFYQNYEQDGTMANNLTMTAHDGLGAGTNQLELYNYWDGKYANSMELQSNDTYTEVYMLNEDHSHLRPNNAGWTGYENLIRMVSNSERKFVTLKNAMFNAPATASTIEAWATAGLEAVGLFNYCGKENSVNQITARREDDNYYIGLYNSYNGDRQSNQLILRARGNTGNELLIRNLDLRNGGNFASSLDMYSSADGNIIDLANYQGGNRVARIYFFNSGSLTLESTKIFDVNNKTRSVINSNINVDGGAVQLYNGQYVGSAVISSNFGAGRHAITLGWDGSRLILYVDTTFIGYVNTSK